MPLFPLLLLVHLLAAAFWVGGMAVVHFAVRPAVAEALPAPPLRLALMAALLRRFFAAVSVAIVLLLASGVSMILLGGGFAHQPPGVHLMFGIGLVMAAIFARIRLAWYARMQRALAASDAAAAAGALQAIRRLVGINLVLGVLSFAAAALGSALA
ncbi:MAG: hypothetical protein ABT20_00605 [Rubrivivax sp. SCN 70-15]|nr:MAG: hypothetical protein ABT20_00605 [Rubrivivax sp. SCN 70-15]